MTAIATLTLNPAVDRDCSVRQVVAERKLRCSEPHDHPGGGGINVARAVTRLGGNAVAYWTCGGAIGELLRQMLDAEGLRHHAIPIRAMTRQNLIVFEESSTLQYRFGMPGALLQDDEITACIDRLHAIDPAPAYIVLSGSLPTGVGNDVYARIIRAVGGLSRVVLDTSGAALLQALDAPVYLIKPNINELEQLAGREIQDDSQVSGVARSLIDAGRVEVVLTSLGSAGAALTTADQHIHIRAPTVKIRSKVGAGDSTVAGVVTALSQGKPIADAARLGVAAGSAAVMTEGTELCRREDVERLYQEMTAANA